MGEVNLATEDEVVGVVERWTFKERTFQAVGIFIHFHHCKGRVLVARGGVLMTSLRACLLLSLLWAVVYLPGLGSQEIRGEEWRRILPGRTMINTGEWLVPQIGGKPYLRKPPLINWISAASFKLTGIQNEWSARLPSVLTVLGAAVGMWWFLHKAVGVQSALVGSVFFLGMAGVVEKGRLAELEVYYIAFTGLAFAAWLAGLMGTLKTGWSWTWAGVFLGLGMLIKGPVHLLFFYALVIGGCWGARRWKGLFSLAHLWALVLCFGIFAAWAVPFAQAYGKMVGVSPGEVLEYWNAQIASRATSADSTASISEEDGAVEGMVTRMSGAVALFLPSILVLLLAGRRRDRVKAFGDGDRRRLYLGLMLGAVAGWLVMMLMPGASARYVAPLFAPVALLTGWFMADWWSDDGGLVGIWWRRVLLGVVGLVALGALVFAGLLLGEHLAVAALGLGLALGLGIGVWWGLPRGASLLKLSSWTTLALGLGALMVVLIDLRRDEIVKPTALAMKAVMDPSEGPLYVLRLGATPYLFYLPGDAVEVANWKEIPKGKMSWLLTDQVSYERYGSRLQRDHGEAEVRGEFDGTWGARELGKKMLVIRFAGRK
jgi:4-amino-4-deoxy-L-arabinose transferase-like glycosyltransferase